AEGELVVNAPHIPVHLGALGLCVRTLQRHGFLEGEESIVTNHPAFGGSHLPDVTMVTPVRVHGELLGFIANRAHHAEIGGCRPGSMPPDARTLVEEGVVIPPTPFSEVIQGSLFRDGPFPTRNWLDNEADLYAQQAANQRGRQALLALAEKHSAELVASELNHLIQRAHQNLRQTLSDRGIAKRSVESHLDDGTRICLSAERTAAGLSFDFTGTSSCHPGNLNATEAIVRSALLYVLRLWSGADLPLNEGFLRGVSVHLPENSFLSPLFSEDPADCPAVVGGNVETSQRLVDTLLSLFGLCAESQGTMNNLLFGNESFGYYETIGGGSGAGPSFPGTSGRHCHMTNTAITDPEILEHRYPVRLREFSLRRGSGGVGRFQGGDGLRRAIEFLEPLEVSLLTQQRKTGPRGSEGGVDAAPGRQRLFRAKGEGSGEILPAITALSAGKGDWLLLETPGGGGWGNPDEPPTEVETSETSPASLPSPPSDASSAPR
ncbi:MAG: hydantoinase B/oxoprolinase family protein, partial [Verrucomicrobiota bacterium]